MRFRFSIILLCCYQAAATDQILEPKIFQPLSGYIKDKGIMNVAFTSTKYRQEVIAQDPLPFLLRKQMVKVADNCGKEIAQDVHAVFQGELGQISLTTVTEVCATEITSLINLDPTKRFFRGKLQFHITEKTIEVDTHVAELMSKSQGYFKATDANLKAFLKKQPRLSSSIGKLHLSFSKTEHKRSDVGTVTLHNLRYLEVSGYGDIGLSADETKLMNSLTPNHLESLSFQNIDMLQEDAEDLFKNYLIRLQKLNKLSVSGELTNHFLLTAVSPKLTELKLTSPDLNGFLKEFPNVLQHFTLLKTLILHTDPDFVFNAQVFEKLPESLEKLDLGDTCHPAFEAKHLTQLRSLTALNTCQLKVEQTLPETLRVLSIGTRGLTTNMLQALKNSNIQNLKVFSALATDEITTEQLSELIQASVLFKTLKLHNIEIKVPVGEVEVAALESSKLEHLEMISLNPGSDDAASIVAGLIRASKNLKFVEVTFKSRDNSGRSAIFKSIMVNAKIVAFNSQDVPPELTVVLNSKFSQAQPQRTKTGPGHANTVRSIAPASKPTSQDAHQVSSVLRPARLSRFAREKPTSRFQ